MVNNITKDELLRFTKENIASLILIILKENLIEGKRTLYAPNSLGAILSFEIMPIVLRKDVKDGVLKVGGGFSIYGGDRPSSEVEKLFYSGVDFLLQKGLILQDRTQKSEDIVILTDVGQNIPIDSSRFVLFLEREATEIFKWYKDVLLFIKTEKENGEISCGTGFLFKKSLLQIVTAKHVIEGNKFSVDCLSRNINFDKFEIIMHKERDLAVLLFKDQSILSILSELLSIELISDSILPGETVITIGYPKVAQRYPSCLTEVGTFQGETRDYHDKEYLTISNNIDAGHSGGPLFNLKGQLVGVLTELTEQSQKVSSSGQGGAVKPSDIYGHATPAKYLYDLLI